MDFNETIFITGFPGFIAERLAARLARPSAQFYLLVQKDFIAKAKQTVEKIAAATSTPLENFALVEGDITQKNLGISDEDLQVIRAQTTDVFHLAAVYDLGVKKEIAFQVNVEGTRNVNEFVADLPALRRYNYISTCYVAGRRTGEIAETELEHAAGFRNYYEETKYLAEIEVERLKGKFPVTIYRPSVVVGDSNTGETAKYDGIYSLIHYLIKAPQLLRFVNVGNSVVRLNLVPVDFVVEGIAVLSKDERAIGVTVALADPQPLSTGELFDQISESLINKKSLIKPPSALVEKCLMLPFSPAFSGLPFPSVPYFFVPQSYDTRVAVELLAAHGIACPSFTSYVGNLLKFVKAHPKL